MYKNIKKLVGILVIGFTLLLVGCSANSATDSEGALSASSLAESGTLYLKVNPEIAIDYDENGKVTGIVGVNDDGSDIVNLYPDFIGKDSGLVVKDLIALIGEAGFFVEEIEGSAKKIVIELEAGSVIPGDNFLEVMASSAQSAVEEYKLNSNVEVDGETYITMDEAKTIAFKHAGIDGANAKFDDQDFDIDDGVPHFELEFKLDGIEYEYDIHAVSGEVLKFEREEKSKPAATNQNNDRGYDDSAYGETAKPVAAPAPKAETKKSTPAPKQNPAPAPKPAAKPATTKKADTDYSDYSDYDDTDYSDYDDTDYSDYDDTDYSDYDDSDYDDSDYN